jgi:hypothetical protein
MKLVFVDNAKKWYHMFSIRGLAVIGGVQLIVLAMPERLALQHVPFFSFTWTDASQGMTFVMAILTALGRLLYQENVQTKPEEPQ